MSRDWKTLIVSLLHWKQVLAQHDPLGAFPWDFPNAGTKLDKVLRAEAFIHGIFSAEVRDFLCYADGWKGFFINTDLFGTEDFLLGKARHVSNRPELRDFLDEKGWKPREVTPIGAQDIDVDVFLHISPKCANLPGGVVWYANAEVGRFATFYDFFTEIINCTAMLAIQETQASGG